MAQSLYEATKWWSGSFCGEILPDPPKQSYSCSKDVSNGVVLCQELKGKQAEEMLLQRLRGGGSQKTHESCTEISTDCCGWAATGECDNNPGFMLEKCQKSCNLCSVSCREDCCPPNTPAAHSIEQSPSSSPKQEVTEIEAQFVDAAIQEPLGVHAEAVHVELHAAAGPQSKLSFRESMVLAFIAGSLLTSLLMYTFSPRKKLERHKNRSS